MKLFSILTVSVLTLCFMSGCMTEGKGATRWFGVSNSYDLVGESVRVKTSHVSGYTPRASIVGADAVIGLAIDAIEDGLRKEAERHTQVYSGSNFTNGSFNIIEVIRGTKSAPNPAPTSVSSFNPAQVDDPAVAFDPATPHATITGMSGSDTSASHTVFLLVPVFEDSRMFRVVLTEFTVRSSKAKVALFTSELDIDIAMSIEGTWTAGNGLLQRHALMMGGGVGIRGYDITSHATIYPNRTVGYVYIPKTEAIRDLALRISVVVTERDASKASSVFTSAADLLRDNRSTITGAVVD